DTRGGKSLAAIGAGPKPPSYTFMRQSVSDPDPLSYTEPQPIPNQDIARSSKGMATEIPTKGVATTEGVTNDCHLDTLEACQDMVDHVVPSGAQVARRNERIQVREEEIKRLGEEVKSLKVMETEVHGLYNQTKNLETLLEAEVDMNKATKQVSTLQAQVIGEERIKVALEEFKKYEDNKVEQRCAEMDARLDKLSVDISEGLK
ncbi:hypothetical protein Tco_0901586, partial [Tanacetum coccineum]